MLGEPLAGVELSGAQREAEILQRKWIRNSGRGALPFVNAQVIVAVTS